MVSNGPLDQLMTSQALHESDAHHTNIVTVSDGFFAQLVTP